MSNIIVETVGNNVVICKENERHKRECYWVKRGDVKELAMTLGTLNIFNCDLVEEIAGKAGIDAWGFSELYCDPKPHPELYGMKNKCPCGPKPLTVKRMGNTRIVCAGEDCVEITTCDPVQLALAIKALGVRDVVYVLNAVGCRGAINDVRSILGDWL